MKWAVATSVALLLVAPASWAVPKSCEELKAEIETKIQAAGVTSYTLEIVDKSEVKDPSMVVGSCDGGKRRIIYQKNDS
ncbi:DUF1161 domain-containing protein [Pseudomonas sp. PSE14]|uniref:DUF1161 domain-containing protein n=1 Tax=Pseudomonas sp. PSE14 TaxID=3016341 RepID=UPI0023D7FC1F|nr:DUF1161 domain-containing protein [Pseudomonas sp. PSE14]WEJ75078.1 DUF1161 domain-containing protein [Pseudomonas sp. PSE14]